VIVLSRLSRSSLSLAALLLVFIGAQPLLALDSAPPNPSQEDRSTEGPASPAGDRSSEKISAKSPGKHALSKEDRAPLNPITLLTAAEPGDKDEEKGKDEDEAPTNIREEVKNSVKRLLERMKEQQVSHMWSSVRRLEELGKDVIPTLEEKLGSGNERVKLGCAKALIHLGDLETRENAIAELTELIQNQNGKKVQSDVKVAAIQILGEHGDPDEVFSLLKSIADREINPDVSIALAKTLYEIDYDSDSRTTLRKYLQSRDPEIRKSAALALAEIDNFEPDVLNILRELKREPTLRGRLALSLYESNRLFEQRQKRIEAGDEIFPGADPKVLIKQQKKEIAQLEARLDVVKSQNDSGSNGDPVIDEIYRIIKRNYVEPKRVDRRDLTVEAIKGMARSLDDFSSFFDADQAKRFLTDISGNYVGIGAQVIKPDPDLPLEIAKPIYGGPAYEKGILTGDKILEVDGVTTTDRSLAELVDFLKGEPGTEINLKVHRSGWGEPKDLTLVRRTVQIPSVTRQMLPGKIGLLKLDQFGEESAADFREAVLQLEEESMVGLILDLRDNPGGMLKAALPMIDMFVGKEDRPMVVQKGRDEEGEVASWPTEEKRPDYPLVILVNQRSASASEIVAGALKDYNRAVVIGQKTYGKGTVQSLYPLSPKAREILGGGDPRLRLTIKYWYLPSGRCVHKRRDEKGKVIEGCVEPDIKIVPKKTPAWEIREIEKLRYDKTISKYVEERYDSLKNLVLSGDNGDPSRYEGFEELYKSLDTKATEGSLRRLVRFHVRRHIEDEQGRELAGDFQDDVQLQRGILEVLQQLELDHPSYAHLKESFAEKEKDDAKEEQ